MITLAHVAGSFGLKGFVKLKVYTEYLDSILQYSPIYLVNGDTVIKSSVVDHLIKNDVVYVKFLNINDRTDADKLRSFSVCIHHDQLKRLTDGEFYWHDILGFSVINTQKEILGIFDSLFNGGATEILVVKNEKQDILIPFVPEVFIKEINTQNKCIIVDWQT
jgi:16S rRNA processing protein RimM